MNQFIKKILVFFILLSVLSVIIVFFLDFLGWSDTSYKKLKSTGEVSLILGDSRAAQGIHPDVINKELLGERYALPIFNFAFTARTSPYGEVYYNAIEKKISGTNIDNGLFILAVDPWSLSFNEGETLNNLREMPECLSEVDYYMKPNFQYIWKYARPIPLFSLMHLKDDGWLEIDVSMDSVSLCKRIENKKREYSKDKISRSEYRIQWLNKTIDYLKSRGHVVMCRIPASPWFYELEDSLWPNFEEDMIIISKDKNIPYFSFKNHHNKYQTIDGNHLYKDDGGVFTKDLCDSIKYKGII